MAARRLLILDVVLAGTGGRGVDVLEKVVLSRRLRAVCVHVQIGPDACMKAPQKTTGFLPSLFSPAQSFTRSVFLICVFPQENFSSAPFFFFLSPLSLSTRDSLPFLPVCCFLFSFSPVVVNLCAYSSPSPGPSFSRLLLTFSPLRLLLLLLLRLHPVALSPTRGPPLHLPSSLSPFLPLPPRCSVSFAAAGF